MSANRFVVLCALLLTGVTVCSATSGSGGWSAAQLAELRSLSIAELEPLAPRTYNRLADAWQRALERSPAGLAFSTAFVAVFERS